LRILFIGDVVGAAGMTAVKSMLPDAISRWEVDLAVVNGENSAGTGFGITEDTYQGIRGAGADVVTLGNHSWNRKEALSFIGTEPRLVRPLNYVPGTPGQGFVRVETVGGKRVLVLNALGRLFMEPTDDPFGAIDRLLQAYKVGRDVDAIIVDFHCEATGEKQAMGHFCDGRVSLVVGTHTHTPSADHRRRRDAERRAGPAFRHGRDVRTVPACRGRGVNVRCRCRNRSGHRSCQVHRTGEVGWSDRTANTRFLGMKENVVVLQDMPTLRLLAVTL
jgi:metallophosphoesterase (TIGR00282 family)